MLKFGQPRKDEPSAKAEPAVDPPVSRPPLLVSDPRPEEGSQMPNSNVNNGESILAAGLTIEGKIEGTGNFRVVGRFKGTVKVNGELTVEPGAFVEGEITAESVLVAGDVRGQIAAASRVEFKDSGTLIGDVKASSVVVSAGSKMRGKMEFGWKEGEGEEVPTLRRAHPAQRGHMPGLPAPLALRCRHQLPSGRPVHPVPAQCGGHHPALRRRRPLRIFRDHRGARGPGRAHRSPHRERRVAPARSSPAYHAPHRDAGAGALRFARRARERPASLTRPLAK
jgi:cytoskeletal protein CcmA (bactofilin family)